MAIKNIKKTLEGLNNEQLIEIIESVYEESSSCKALIQTLVSTHDPKSLASILGKQITRIKAGKKYISYYEASSFVSDLYSISMKIDKYLSEQAPDLGLKLCTRLIDMDGSLFERVDDSNGCLGDFYISLFSVLERVLFHSKEKSMVLLILSLAYINGSTEMILATRTPKATLISQIPNYKSSL